MGLNVSHDAWEGAYSAFNRFRREIAAAMGGSWPPHDDKTLDPNCWYWGDGYNEQTHPGLMELLAHSDCDGEISPEICAKVADDLEALLPFIESRTLEAFGHIARGGGYVKCTQRFIDGCRAAAAAGEPLKFS